MYSPFQFRLFLPMTQIPSPTPPPIPAEFNPNQPLLAPLSAAAIVSAFFAWNSRLTSPLVSLFFFVDIVIGLWGLWAARLLSSHITHLMLTMFRCRLSLMDQLSSPRQLAQISTRLPSSLGTRLQHPNRRSVGRVSGGVSN